MNNNIIVNKIHNVVQCYTVARSRNHCCNAMITISFSFIVFGKHVAVNSRKCSVLPYKCNNGLALHCYRVLTIMNIKHYECVPVVLPQSSGTLTSSFLCRIIILPFVACPAVPYFSTLSHKRQDFQGKFY
jgi:amino acid permease